MTVSPKKELQRLQRRWAERAGVEHDAQGFVRQRDANLRVPLSPETRAAFARGSELKPRRTRPARMEALHSSAALVANVFDYWTGRDTAALVAALGLGHGSCRISFEEPIPTGVAGDPPFVDVLLRLGARRVVAIESKLGEWLVRRPANKADLKPKYFPAGRALWADRGLPRCQHLAEGLRDGKQRFEHLHAGQLLKHALGLAAAARGAFAIRYLYYDTRGRPSAQHREELARFASLVDGEIAFTHSTYQELYLALRRSPGVDSAYLEYLRSRYFRDAK
jgi:hypothetical protein